ncbi:MAG TPA: hypothetical protein VKT52_12545 [Ktedonobacterales bacterium]|nr:hypothetical protein [Ktedonobacterales bacterium]
MPAQRAPSEASQPSQPGAARTLQRQLRGLRTGITLTALLGGLALYIFLSQLGLPGVLAAILGFVFALLGRIAMVSLLRDWLLHASRSRK